MNFKDFLSKGLIKKQHVNYDQIEKQIARAEKDLQTFKLLIEDDPEWTSSVAYQAMLRAGRALLFSYGFLPADGQQHKTVVEITGRILGDKYDLLVKKFNKLRKKEIFSFTIPRILIITQRRQLRLKPLPI